MKQVSSAPSAGLRQAEASLSSASVFSTCKPDMARIAGGRLRWTALVVSRAPAAHRRSVRSMASQSRLRVRLKGTGIAPAMTEARNALMKSLP